jgi:hypothetical protein
MPNTVTAILPLQIYKLAKARTAENARTALSSGMFTTN